MEVVISTNNMHDSNANNTNTLWYKHPEKGWVEATRNLAMEQAYKLKVLDTLRDTPPTAAPVRSDEHFASIPGFAAKLPKTWFPAGTPLIGAGKAKARSKASLHAALPSLTEASAEFTARLAAENRRWKDIDLSKLRIYEGGFVGQEGVTRDDGTPKMIPIEPAALWGLLSRYSNAFKGGTAPHIQDYTEDFGAFASKFNRRMRDLSTYLKKGQNVQGRMLIRWIDGQPQVFALHSNAYMPINPAMALGAIQMEAQRMGLDDPRVDLTYDAATTRVEARVSYHAAAEQIIREGVGSVYESGLFMKTDDRGGSSLDIGGFLLRAICVNLTTVDAYAEPFRRRHRTGRTTVNRAIARSGAEIRAGVRSQMHYLDAAARAYSADIVKARSVEIAPYTKVLAALTQIRDSVIPAGDRSRFTDKGLASAWEATRRETGDAPRAMNGEDVVNVFSRAARDDLFSSLQRWDASRAAAVLVPAMAARA